MNKPPLLGRLYFITVLLAGLTACSGDETPTASPDPMPYTIEYTALTTGDGVISELIYIDDNGRDVVVSNPVLPWSIPLAMAPGVKPVISVTGTISQGQLIINIHVNGNGHNVNIGDLCSGAGTQINCELEASGFVLN